jgi:hypothetical protein
LIGFEGTSGRCLRRSLRAWRRFLGAK